MRGPFVGEEESPRAQTVWWFTFHRHGPKRRAEMTCETCFGVVPEFYIEKHSLFHVRNGDESGGMSLLNAGVVIKVVRAEHGGLEVVKR